MTSNKARRDAVQLVRTTRTGNRPLRAAILSDYGIDEHEHPIADLIQHFAYFIHELVEDNPDRESDWLDIRFQNLVCGPHEDAHRLFMAAFDGAWEEAHEHIDGYLPDDAPSSEERRNLIIELAMLANSAHRTEPSCYANWPEDFYTAHYALD